MDDLDVQSKSQDHRKARSCAVILLFKLHEATQMFMMVDYVGGMTGNKSCKANMGCLSICSLWYGQIFSRVFGMVLVIGLLQFSFISVEKPKLL